MIEGEVAPPVGDTAKVDASDWTAGLTPELKALVTGKGYKTPGDVVQAYDHAQRAIGADKIPAPKDGVWDPIALEKLGVPKDASGYQLKRPDMPAGLTYDENFEKAAIPILHKMGIPPAGAQALLDFYAGNQSQQHQAAIAARETQRTAGLVELKGEWGAAFDSKVEVAQRAALTFGGQELIDAFNANGLAGNKAMVKAFEKIGALMGEDQLKTGKSQSMVFTPAEALIEANKIMRTEVYLTNKDPTEHKAAVDQVSMLMQQAHPEQSAA
jgi:hypothetical protein